MNAHGTPWTEADLAALSLAWREGKTVQEIGTAMRRSTDAIYAKIKRLPYTARRAHDALERDQHARIADRVLGQAWRPDETLTHDAEYVALCRAEGGFVAFSERTAPRGYVACCLPIIRPVFA